ncbi:MAG TPA: PEGA domain-containing protein [Polyangia bacterium]|nr:PEGA domain-containing protein [Polyangia bacterium]
MVGGLLAVSVVLGAAPLAGAAQDAHPSRQEADKHFEHGVALYMEADYRAALVEFLRAYELAPNGVVLFNIGETQYQLRDYAAALATFERYLAESPQNDSHRQLVEANVKELRTRVGRLTITTFPVGAEITVDDRVIGKTPFGKPVVVGIGRLNVRAYLPGHLPVTRSVDVAAEDNLSISFDLPSAVSMRAEAPAFAPAAAAAEPPRAPSNRSAWRKAGWISAGMLAAGAAGVALWARDESSALRDARNRFPADAGRVHRLSDKTLTLSVIADSLGAAAIVVGAITLYASVSAKEGGPSTSVSAGPGSVTLLMTF